MTDEQARYMCRFVSQAYLSGAVGKAIWFVQLNIVPSGGSNCWTSNFGTYHTIIPPLISWKLSFINYLF